MVEILTGGTLIDGTGGGRGSTPAIRAEFDGEVDGLILCPMDAEMSLACPEAAGRTLRELGRG
jgi:hypothetical protein